MTSPSIRGRMVARNPSEPHRASSPLELLFDLTFVVAISQVAAPLAEGHGLDGIVPYLMVFFAIWWAWMNFTWFASAYDIDDVPYRLLTMLQMAGVLVLAAGVPAAFEGQDYVFVTVGYLIMRVGLVSQWIRAGVEHPQGRVTAFRYAGGVTLVQLGWVARLALPPEFGVASFVVLAVLDLSVPLWAERTGSTSWHPHHIAERYGLFTIILLGESVSAATIAVKGSLSATGVSAGLVEVAVGGLVLLFALWWLYYLEPAGAGLAARRNRSFLWGYGHYVIFASLAAVGAALEVAVEHGAGEAHLSDAGAALALAVPVALFLASLSALHAPLASRLAIRPAAVAIAVALILAVPLAAPANGLPSSVLAIALVAAALAAVTIADPRRRGETVA
ncbi:low temperature requirement protein A [Lacisediminihabitans sp.]|uniref:low temperature requirement protein A n=1 Tax=Lacisediminihabitans sp. TaxID=2787631 RepID=UPI00374D4A72